LFKLLTEEGVWQTLLRRKYIGSKAVSQFYWKPRDSHFWVGLMHTKNSSRFGSFLIKDGSGIRFWEDSWLGNIPLMEQYPALYNIAHNKSDIIAKVLNASPPNVAFRRDLIGEFRWNLTENGKFSVDSMYKALVHSEVPINTNISGIRRYH